jgi:hypothetical protein
VGARPGHRHTVFVAKQGCAAAPRHCHEDGGALASRKRLHLVYSSVFCRWALHKARRSAAEARVGHRGTVFCHDGAVFAGGMDGAADAGAASEATMDSGSIDGHVPARRSSGALDPGSVSASGPDAIPSVSSALGAPLRIDLTSIRATKSIGPLTRESSDQTEPVDPPTTHVDTPADVRVAAAIESKRTGALGELAERVSRKALFGAAEGSDSVDNASERASTTAWSSDMISSDRDARDEFERPTEGADGGPAHEMSAVSNPTSRHTPASPTSVGRSLDVKYCVSV